MMKTLQVVARIVMPLAAAAIFVAPLCSPAMAEAAPAKPVILSPAQSALVASTFLIRGRVEQGVTGVSVSGVDTFTITAMPDSSEGGTFTVSVTVHKQWSAIKIGIRASDGSGSSDSAALTVWQLGAVPTASRFVLVDKSDFMLYVVRGRAVIAAYPIAIGTRGTPTHTGTRYLGRPVHAPNSVWGPFRMRLYRKARVRVAYHVRVGGRRVTRHRTVLKLVGTSFYIHGTNNPSSIGTPASHGCIRLWNSKLRIFRTLTVKYELTVIRA